ncbi:sulfotransferase 1B1-like [Ostrea edulis]|uniref:sulfotransferase 1B1-like n=1 Tax=Ostrea edulis TaxID=37623 RepID=UPI0024AF5796|nr:sulfotransferase 1B1-like [Ostrea edulis]
MNCEKQQPLAKYNIGSLEGETIAERKCPSGFSFKSILLHGHYRDLTLAKSGFIPDLRSHVPELRSMEIFDDDVLIHAFPKCGTHWVWEMITMLHKGKAEYEKRPKEVAMLEFHSVDKFCGDKRPRVFNTHLFPNQVPTAFLEGKGKSLFLLRNPKDVSVSFYHHIVKSKLSISWMSWDDYVYLVINYGGTFSDWYEYTTEWEKEINMKKTNYLCIYYEEMLKNPLATLKSIAKHLGIPCSETLAEEIVHKCKLENMRSANKDKYDDRNESGPNPEMHDPDTLYRKGEVGDWKNHFTVAQNEEFDKVYQKKMKDSSFHFIFK